jgi:hypothetical protein
MPNIDLEPHEYTVRKPRGWRWRLPWSHDDDNKLPVVMLLVMIGGLTWLFLNRNEASSDLVTLAAAGLGFVVGIMLMLALRD